MKNGGGGGGGGRGVKRSSWCGLGGSSDDEFAKMIGRGKGVGFQVIGPRHAPSLYKNHISIEFRV
jgi:hypothetical protein